MPSTNPFGDFRAECEQVLGKALAKAFPRVSPPSPALTIPPTLELGDLASSVCFALAKEVEMAPRAVAERVVEEVDLSETPLVRDVQVAGGGYINFHADHPSLSRLTLESAKALGETYGYVQTGSPLKIIVEHTSVNPAGPIHVGTARNSVLGDSLARLLKARGHEVSTHFYVDDVGRQIAVLAYGYGQLGQPAPEGKADHWIGLVYAATNCTIEINRLRDEVRRLVGKGASVEKLNATKEKLDNWVSDATRLRNRDDALFDSLFKKISEAPSPEGSVAKIMRLYEEQDSEVKRRVREVVALCLAGFHETYSRVGIRWDHWDWESDLVWDGSVARVVEALKASPYSTVADGALAVDVEEAAKRLGLKKAFGVSEEHEIPPLILVRSDGTTLYPTRDIAYSLWKLGRADRVINVIGAEQSLPQLQLRIALSVLASPERAGDLVHYSYELVKLPGYRMSKRRGRYVAFDDVLDEAFKQALAEVEKRSPELPEGLKRRIAEAVGVGAVKYALVSVAPSKQVVFTWDRVLNFEMNSAPFIQYAHARACNILKKAGERAERPDYALLKEPAERELVRTVALFPEVFVDAAERLEPSRVAEFANDLAARFNSFYAALPVLRAEPAGLRGARLSLVTAVRVVLRNALRLLGIVALERM